MRYPYSELCCPVGDVEMKALLTGIKMSFAESV
jgi:hypothetical protein